MTALERIAAERAKQCERWGPSHDDQHHRGELALAAGCYALHHTDAVVYRPGCRFPWPFEQRFDRRFEYDAVHRLVLAGAFIVAEIERIERLRARGEPLEERLEL